MDQIFPLCFGGLLPGWLLVQAFQVMAAGFTSVPRRVIGQRSNNLPSPKVPKTPTAPDAGTITRKLIAATANSP